MSSHESVAWCWASGVIEIGPQAPAPGEQGDECMVIAQGPAEQLESALRLLANPGLGACRKKLLVPGMAEAGTRQKARDALSDWLDWCVSNVRLPHLKFVNKEVLQ